MEDHIDNEGGAEVVDLEELASGKARLPDRECRFRVRIDREYYLVDKPVIAGAELLKLAGKSPPRFKLVQRLRGGKSKSVAPDEPVDLREPGIERFNTMACDQQEGEAARREFEFGSEDREFLDGLGVRWETVIEGAARWLIIYGWELPDGYDHKTADIAIQVPRGYPDTQLDMVFFHPVLARSDGKALKATGGRVKVGGRSFQQWSRHRTAANPWRPGVDGVPTHFHLVIDWLAREFR